MAIRGTTTEFHSVTPVYRAGCPCQMAPLYQLKLPTENRTELIQQFAAMKLVHLSKAGATKSSLDLSVVHHELKMDALTVDHSGASNILVCSVSFDCLITHPEGETRDYLTFELKVPGMNTDNDSVLAFENVAKMYGGQSNLYAALKHFYTKGRETVNPNNKKHGHEPDYDPSTSKHDQYIRHTEQMVVAYLARPEAAVMLRNRLRAEIRGKYANATEIKVYNMGLHMHSTKTCCAPCEYTLLGLMNQPGALVQNGFIANFRSRCLEKDERILFTFPRRSQFRLLVTVTAGETDAHHQTAPSYTPKALSKRDPLPFREILVKDPSVSERIFTTLFTEKHDERRKPEDSSLAYRTVAISGSLKTAGSPGTITRVKAVRAKEDKKLGERLSQLSLEG